MTIHADLNPNEIRNSLDRLDSTFYGNYNPIPLFEGDRPVGRIEEQNGRIYITFRGSVDSFLEVLTCLRATKTSPSKWGLGGAIHTGIYNGFCKVEKSIDECLERLARSSGLDLRRTEFVIEGYSRGSSFAMLTAAHLVEKLGIERMKVLTYSTMNIFNKEAVEAYNRAVPHHWNFHCEQDSLLGTIGSETLGFYSPGKKVSFSAAPLPSYKKRVENRKYTNLTRNWVAGPILRRLISPSVWEAHMLDTYREWCTHQLQT